MKVNSKKESDTVMEPSLNLLMVQNLKPGKSDTTMESIWALLSIEIRVVIRFLEALFLR